MEDLELELEQIGKEMRFCKICGNTLTGHQRNYCKNNKCKLIANNLILKKKRDEARVTFPKYVCQYCGFVEQLNYSPHNFSGLKRLRESNCPNCGTNRAC